MNDHYLFIYLFIFQLSQLTESTTTTTTVTTTVPTSQENKDVTWKSKYYPACHLSIASLSSSLIVLGANYLSVCRLHRRQN